MTDEERDRDYARREDAACMAIQEGSVARLEALASLYRAITLLLHVVSGLATALALGIACEWWVLG